MSNLEYPYWILNKSSCTRGQSTHGQGGGMSQASTGEGVTVEDAANKHAWQPNLAQVSIHRKSWHRQMKKLKCHSLVMVPAPAPVQISSQKKLHLHQEPQQVGHG
eukprot:CAMPEP_0171316340 /NCGR_PEP_ID=MMETSP0816-20121228/72053_1 /TAXON_ID=420281 /ORGANISM="Proboscia inermis, Strain CCAP1064/1" /LENGTH=104 /DNA_ID=CAMNT_0011808193 /DNA_START=444 /DNA_END=758 /DNA_ORIENTATION=+